MNWEKIIKSAEYTDGAWSIEWDANNGFLIENGDLHHIPFYGGGKTEREAFANMLKNIEQYEEKLKKAKAEIAEHLKKLGEQEND